MVHVSVDISLLPQDVLTYTDQRFFDFVQRFCGKDEVDLLAVQAIRSVDLFLSIEDLYSIFAFDSEDLDAIQKRCGFKIRNGTYVVRPGIKSTLDNLRALLNEKQKQTKKMKKNRLISIQSTTLSTSSNSISSSSINTNINSFVSKKTEAEHLELINKCIKEWCTRYKEELDIPDFNFTCDVDYHIQFSSSLEKAEIKCSCNLSSTLILGGSGNFKISNYFRHLKTNCSVVQNKAMSNSNNTNESHDKTAISRDSSTFSSEQLSTNSVRKRTRRATAIQSSTKKIRTA